MMKKKSILICICAVVLTLSACSTSKSKDSNEIAAQEEAVKEEVVEKAEELEDIASEKKNDGASLPFLSHGSEVCQNGRYELVSEEVYFDQPAIDCELHHNLVSFSDRSQVLFTYVDESKKSYASDEELLDQCLINESEKMFYQIIDDSSMVKSYSITKKEAVTLGDIDCNHYTLLLIGTYPDSEVEREYTVEAYCLNFAGFPIVMAGMADRLNDYSDTDALEIIRNDISNNLIRMISTMNAEKK